VTGDARSAPTTSGAGAEQLDARLAVPAVSAWVGAFLGTGLAPAAAATLAGVATLLVAVGVALGQRRHLAHSAAVRVTAAGALCLWGAVLVGALHRGALAAGAVDDLAAERASLSGTATVTSDPRRAGGSSRPDRLGDLWVVPVRLERYTARGRSARERVPVVAFARDRGWAQLLPGQQVELAGRLGPARPGRPVAATIWVRGPPVRVGEPSLVQRAAGSLRAGLRDASAGLPPAERGLLPGLVVGDTSRLPDDVEADFRAAGLTHLTAVSGANLAIVTGFVLVVGRYVGVRGRWLPALAALAMAGFVVLARPQPSVVRAAAMGLVALAALAGGRTRRSLAALGASVLVLVLVDPWLARSYGFVLSVLATGGLVLLAPRWAASWQHRGAPRPLAQVLAVPLAAQLACAPVVVMLSGQVSLVAVPANVLVAPAVAPATVLGVLSTVASAVHDPSARLLARVASVFVWWVVAVARRSAAAPAAAVDWPGSAAGALLLAALLAASVVAARRLARHPLALAAAAVVVCVAVVVPASGPGWPPRGWLFAACDVGQGDALVLGAGPGRGVVVDAGPDPDAVDRCLRRLGVREVPVVVLTHLHADHVAGLPGVLRRRAVGEVQVGLYDEPAEELVRVRHWCAGRGVPVTRALAGDQVRVGPVSWRVVWPTRVIDAGSVPNNASTVLVVRARGVTLLLTGDVEPEAQQALLSRGLLGPADVLKVAHHGSAYQAGGLLSVVRPRVAVISVGAGNDYGHPAPSTMAALRKAGALVGRTDRDGTLVVVGPARRLSLVRGHR
jgi:competence protein ComEC